jgi:peptidyl-prolyl cis-trans isomerase C
MNLFQVFQVPRMRVSRSLVALMVVLRRSAAAASCAALLATTGSSFAQAPQAGATPTPAAPQAQVPASTEDPVIARVGDAVIHESDLILAEEDIGNTLKIEDGVPADPKRREYMINYLADVIRLSKAATARNVGDEAVIKQRMEHARRRALMNALLRQTAQDAITDEALHKFYDKYLATVHPEPELQLRQIIVRFSSPDDQAAVKAAEDKARAAKALIDKGEDFGAVAAKTTEDTPGRMLKGEVGFRTRGAMGKEYAEVAFKLPKGGVSEPFKTTVGWHIIQVEDQRMSTLLDFDEFRDRYTNASGRNAQVQLVEELRAATPTQRLDQQAASPAEAGK